jgi:TonB family protein
MNIKGSVKVDLTVAPNGSVKKTRVIGGNPVLVTVALDAVRQWKFEPGPEDTTEMVELRFSPSN